MSAIIANWKYITIALLSAIIVIQALQIKQYKIDELQAKVKVIEHTVTVMEKRNEIANHRPSDKQLSDRLRKGSF